MAVEHRINRRQFMMTASVVGGAFVLGFALSSQQVRAATIAGKPWTCPVFGGTLKRYDFNAIKSMPRVRAAVEVPNGIAVVANSFWRAKTALEVMLMEWDFGVHVNANSETFRKTFREALDKPGVVAKEEGDALAAIKTAGKVVEADYEVPYLAHACMEPMNCMAQVRPERVDVWVGTHNPEAVLAAAAEITGMGLENVYVHNCFLGGDTSASQACCRLPQRCVTPSSRSPASLSAPCRCGTIS
jgi:CO/xanthine dehydrogenase Mo-binding subunit